MSKSGPVILAGLGVAAFAVVSASASEYLRRALPGLSPAGLIAANAGTIVALAGAAILPLALGARRNIQRLSARMERAAEEGTEEPFGAPGLSGALLAPIVGAWRAWVERYALLNGRLREAEIRLSVSEAERRHGEAILNSLQDAVIVTDSFNEISLANEPAARLLGFDLGASSHQPIDSVLGDETLRRLIKEACRAGVVSKQKHIEHRLTPAPGEEKGKPGSFDVTLACLPDGRTETGGAGSGGGRGGGAGVGGVVTILRDVTREKEISEMKSDFVSQASHELRTPLSSINAYIEVLLDNEAKDEATRQEFYQIIKSEADRVTRMIDNMLNISRIEAGIVSVDRTEVDFVKVTAEVLDAMQPQAALKSITLHKKSGPLLYSAQADRDMMFQVIMNLVSNAVKYTPDGGRVTVSVENDDTSRSVLVGVSDTGLGIPPDALKRLFEKFFRIESYKRMAKGTGLGLNLVKHIVETVHHGVVGVESEVGSGSRFWFTIPYEYEGA